MLVRSRMSRQLITVAPDTPIAEALSLSRQNRVRHLPVVENERLVGIVTDRDIRLAIPPIWADAYDELQDALRTRTVSEVMTTQLITAHGDMPIEEAAKLLYAHRIGCVPVVAGEQLEGILTERDVLQAFVDLFGVNQPSSRIEVMMENRPGELARVIRLVGIEHRINITGLVVPPTRGNESSVAIMHLQTLNPTTLIDGLRRLGYTVGWPSLEIESYGPMQPGDDLTGPSRGVMAHAGLPEK
jgi:acetoin utilization protein AcuB